MILNEKNDRDKVKDVHVRKEASMYTRNKCYETKFKIIKNIFNAVLSAQKRKNKMRERERERELERRADCKRWQK